MALIDRLKSGLSRSRETMNEIFYLGGQVDDQFWEDLEDRLVMGDMGAEVAFSITDDLREQAAREHLTRPEQIKGALAARIAAEFTPKKWDPFIYLPSVVQEACDAAIADLLGRMPEFYADHELTLQLIYSNGWFVRGDDALVAAIQGIE
jgi:hypothetical protein